MKKKAKARYTTYVSNCRVLERIVSAVGDKSPMELTVPLGRKDRVGFVVSDGPLQIMAYGESVL